jgi:hypothetical protein
MPTTLDIFRLEKDGAVVWKGTAENLEVAKLSVKVLANTSPGDYMIFSRATGDKTVLTLESGA